MQHIILKFIDIKTLFNKLKIIQVHFYKTPKITIQIIKTKQINHI